MVFKKFKEEKDNLTASYRLMKFFVVVISVAIVFASLSIARLVRNEKVVVLYPDGSKIIEVQGDNFNKDYFDSFATYATHYRLNYTSFNFGSQSERLLKISSGRYAPKLKNQLLELQNSVVEFQICSAFYIRDIKVDPNDRTIRVEGLLFESAHGTSMLNDRGEPKTYILKYENGKGGLLLDDFSEKA